MENFCAARLFLLGPANYFTLATPLEGRIHSNNLSLNTFNYSDIDEDDGTIVDSSAPIGDATTADENEPGDLYKAQYNNIKYAPSSFLCDK